MRRIRTANNRGRSSSSGRNRRLSGTTSNVASTLLTLAGLFMSAPFVFDVIVMNNGYAHITLFPGLEILGLVIGGPLFLMGLVSFSNAPTTSVSTNDVDVARIRFAAEQEMTRKDK